MPNDRLRDALGKAGVTASMLAEQLEVDPKTVERWVSTGRAPQPRNRGRIAALLGESEGWLWPNALSPDRVGEIARSEVVQVFPQRALVPFDVWPRLFSGATTYVDLLVYAGLFLPENLPAAVATLGERAGAGVRVRLLLGDPDGDGVLRRGQEEGIGDAVAIKSRNALRLIRRALGRSSQVQLRLHDTTLYTSVYRADDEMIANVHVLGLPAAQAPAIHLRRLAAGGIFDTYATMFDKVWDEATQADM